jgi:Flp pilus assembly protein TadD
MRSSFRRPISLVACLVLACSFTRRCEAGDAQWLEIRSPHFSVATDAGEKRGREVALRFEQMRAVFTVLIPRANVDSATPLQIVAFRNTREFREFAPLWHGKPTELSGLFMSGDDGSFILLDLSVENPYSVVFHEYAHQLLNAMTSHPMDLWFEEGFAEYFSSIKINSNEAQVGRIPDMTYAVLRHTGLMSVSSLFRTRQDSSTYNESGSHQTVFYQESWMVVHYLYDNQLISKLNAYFSAAKKAPVEEALQQAFGMNVAQFDKTLHDYVWDGHYKSFVIPNPPSISSGSFTVAPLSSGEVAMITAEIHLQSPDYQEKAVAEFQAVLKTSPDNAAANRGLGYACLKQKRFDEARNYLRKAAQLGSKDPKIHFYSALLMSHDGAFDEGSDLQEIAKELETAISLDKDYAEAYMLMGFTRMHQDKPALGVAAMEKAASLRPRDERYQFNLAQIYISNQNLDQALTLLHGLEVSGNPELTTEVQQALRVVQQLKNAAASEAQNRPASGADEAEEADEPDKPAEDDPDAPRLQRKPAKAEDQQQELKRRPARYMVATIMSVDCSRPPAATITAVSGAITWKLTAPDVQRIVLFKAGKFSCAWAKQKAGMNYVETNDGEGIVFSVELLP